jgi:hypothetical protein
MDGKFGRDPSGVKLDCSYAGSEPGCCLWTTLGPDIDEHWRKPLSPVPLACVPH